LYTAVWRPSTQGEIQVYGWKYADYRAKYDELWNQGWRLKLLSVYVIGGEPSYTAAWRPSTEGEYQVYGWPYEDLRPYYDVKWMLGWRLKLIDAYVP
jgi:polyglycine hydrolase-like protein